VLELFEGQEKTMRLTSVVSHIGFATVCCAVVVIGQGQVDRPFVPDKDNIPPTTDVRIFNAAGLQGAIKANQTGRILEGNELYSLNLLHRTGEDVTVHGSVVDLYFIQEGSALLEHGGTALDLKPGGGRAGDMRGSAIKGGTRTVVRKGDVVFIPPGVPHRFVAGESDVWYLNAHFPGK